MLIANKIITFFVFYLNVILGECNFKYHNFSNSWFDYDSSTIFSSFKVYVSNDWYGQTSLKYTIIPSLPTPCILLTKQNDEWNSDAKLFEMLLLLRKLPVYFSNNKIRNTKIFFWGTISNLKWTECQFSLHSDFKMTTLVFHGPYNLGRSLFKILVHVISWFISRASMEFKLF